MRSLPALFAFCMMALSFADSLQEPQLASSATVEIYENGTVFASNGQILTLELNVPVPTSTAYQSVQAGGQAYIDAEGNSYLKITSSSPPNPFQYSERVLVQMDRRQTTSLPASYEVPANYSLFISPTNKTQSDDPRIRALAGNITANAQTPFEKVAMLAIFVNSNMEYDTSMAGKEKDAIWVLENRRGVCTEYSRLFVALARSIGIPARYAEGYVYSQQFQSWMGHAWAEAYIGEWVPVDATWFEVGELDSVHIEGARYSENYGRMTLSTTISSEGTIVQWDTSGNRTGAAVQNVVATEISYLPKRDDYSLDVAEAELAPGGSTIVYLAVQGNDYSVMPVMLANCLGSKSIEIGSPDQYLMLAPGKTATAVWEIRASSSLPKDYIYTCPLTLNSPYLEGRSITVKVTPEAATLPFFEAGLGKKNVLPGEEDNAIINRLEGRQGKPFYVITRDAVHKSGITGFAQAVPFIATGIGEQPVYVAGWGGGFYRLSYNSSATGGILTGFSMPKLVLVGRETSAYANLSSEYYPTAFEADFYFNGQHKETAGTLDGPTGLEFSATPKAPGFYIAKATALAGGRSDEQNILVQAIIEPNLSIAGAETSVVPNGTAVALAFLETGGPVSPIISINGISYSAAAPLTLSLPEGNYTAMLEWSDALGNRYSKEAAITVEAPSAFGALKLSPSGLPSLCAPALLFALMAIIIFMRR